VNESVVRSCEQGTEQPVS